MGEGGRQRLVVGGRLSRTGELQRDGNKSWRQQHGSTCYTENGLNLQYAAREGRAAEWFSPLQSSHPTPSAAPHASETPNYRLFALLFAAHALLFLSSLTWIWSPSTPNVPLCFSSLLSIHLLKSSQVPPTPGSTMWPPRQPASWHLLPVSIWPPYKMLSLQFPCYIYQFMSLPHQYTESSDKKDYVFFIVVLNTWVFGMFLTKWTKRRRYKEENVSGKGWNENKELKTHQAVYIKYVQLFTW